MSSKAPIMAALFDQFASFLTELSEMYPDDPDFSMCLTSVRMIRSTNPSMLVKLIYSNTSEYEDKIMSKDEKFFIENTFDKQVDDNNMNIISKLKGYVGSMTPTSKESVWRYCQNIHRLAKACS